MKEFLNKHKTEYEVILSLLLVVAILFITGIGCPIKFFTGISCAGCGMSRALYCMATFDFKAAFYYHPLFFLVPLFAIFLFFHKRVSRKTFKGILIAICVIFVIVYLIRFFDDKCNVVTCTPQNGFILRTIRHLYNGGN